MSQIKHNRMEIHPRTKKWEQTGIALISKEDAEMLNSSTQFTKIKYEAVKRVTKTKQ